MVEQTKNPNENLVRKLPDHIREYFNARTSNSNFIEVFQSEADDFDLKTELNKEEIVVSNVIILDDAFLQSKGINDNIFGLFINEFMRLRVSLDRKSRAEFVNINKSADFREGMEAVGQFANIQKLKE